MNGTVVWRTLFERLEPLWLKYANSSYLNGLRLLELRARHVPSLGDINRFLAPRTGFRAVPVSGYLAAPEFFAHLRRREFPTVPRLRKAEQLDYLPEPDLFHDVCGHVPMHADTAFADALVRIGECAARHPGRLEEIARFFWFTVEFGLMRESGELKAYGSGLLSSAAELEHAMTSNAVERRLFDLDEVLAQPFEIDRLQNRLYIVESFEHLYGLAGRLEWRFSGRKLAA